MKNSASLALVWALFLTACDGKKPDVAQQVRAFLAEWERAIDSKNPMVLDSLLTNRENSTPIDAREFLNRLYSSPAVKAVNLRGRQIEIGASQATVSGVLIRSGIPDSIARLTLTLLKTKQGWKLAENKWGVVSPAKSESESLTLSP